MTIILQEHEIQQLIADHLANQYLDFLPNPTSIKILKTVGHKTYAEVEVEDA